jgi:hypothetical protein
MVREIMLSILATTVDRWITLHVVISMAGVVKIDISMQTDCFIRISRCRLTISFGYLDAD